MGVQILTNKNDDAAVMFCSTSMWAFGPVFEPREGLDASEVGQRFLKWLPGDPRTRESADLEKRWGEFVGLLPGLLAAEKRQQDADIAAEQAEWDRDEADYQARKTAKATASRPASNPLPGGKVDVQG